MTEENNNDDEIDLEALIGNVLESRGFTADRATKLDLLDTLGDSFGKKVEELFTAAKLSGGSPAPTATGSPFDQEAFLGRVGSLVDEKLKGIVASGGGGGNERKVPLFQRMLGVKA